MTQQPLLPDRYRYKRTAALWRRMEELYGQLDPTDHAAVREIQEEIGKQQPATAGGKTEAA